MFLPTFKINSPANTSIGRFEVPPGFGEGRLVVWRSHVEPSTGMTAMRLASGGAGVWDSDGRLIYFAKRGAGIAWKNGPATQLLVLENRFGPCTTSSGVGHVLRWLECPSFQAINEIEMCVPTGGVEHLVVSERTDECVATWLDQTEWGYVIIDLARRRQLSSGGQAWSRPSIAPPAYTPDGSYVVACHFYRSGWWTDEVDDYWERPSPGGMRKAGMISVHDRRSDSVSCHDVCIGVPVGWIPENAESSDWDMVWGPEFVSERTFRVSLPDGSSETLSLPLPEAVEIRRELRWTRR